MVVKFMEFKLNTLYNVLPTNKLIISDNGYTKDDEIISPTGTTPYVAAISTNNGIKGYSDFKPNNKRGVITLSTTADTSNTIFYQNEDFIGRQQIHKIERIDGQEISRYEALYIISLLKKHTVNYNYGNKITVEYINNFKLLLPATSDCTPDWEYMEQYIKEIEKKASLSVKQQNDLEIERLKELVGDSVVEFPNYSNISFNEFDVGDLFDINPTKAYVDFRDDDIISKDGETPFVTTTVSNNGIKGYSKLEPLNQGNVITISDTTGTDSIFYQSENFIGRSHVQGLVPKFQFNRNIGLYIVAAIRKSAAGRYSYGNKFNRERIRNSAITLPVNKEMSDLVPDWNTMEQYIKGIQQKYVLLKEQQNVEQLQNLLLVTGLTEEALLSANQQKLLELLLRRFIAWDYMNIFMAHIEMQARLRLANNL